MRFLAPFIALMVASPALAASGPFISLKNTNFIVLLAFILFILVLFYYKVPSVLGGMLDQRSEGIKSELDQARELREEAQSILASYERKQKEVQKQADRIVESARKDAQASAEQAKEDLRASIERRLVAAEEQLSSAQASVEREVHDKAIGLAVAAARNVIAAQMTASSANKLIDGAITEVDAKMH